ncbi:dihydrolipoyl dehydrogenase [Betaproteobacteria bacterium]|nr:dihydrolipoyl dehydrogenase [Betaproteobacteria bacterium]GHT98340.1 dihydrolipoyl dehydrogenase [Betaproteobacteria bacterium]GHU23356.1 dihydrolipoyl dehydrogenase [Betaproteobacteria bacterium]
MSTLTEIKVPDIGDFSDVPVIEVFVKPGDTVAVDDALVTLESDKATMDVPTSVAGVVQEVLVKSGDRVSEGSLLVRVESGAASGPLSPQESEERKTPSAAPVERADAADVECDLLVLGAGPGGYSAAFRGADLGLKTVLVERYSTLGGVCLNVGCIPSKALLHVSAVIEEAEHLAASGVSFAAPKVDLDALRAHKEGVVKKLTSGLAGMAKGRKVQHLQGVGQFLDAHHLELSAADGKKQVVKFAQAIIAAGSSAVKLPFMPDDERIIDSTGALALRAVPNRMLIIGGGIIGLEMATVYSTLGARVTVVELGAGLMPGADRDLVKVWEKKNARRFARILLDTGVTAASATAEGVEITYSTGEKEAFDLVLVAVGRTPNGKKIAADKAGVAVTERGFIEVDAQQRTNIPHIFAIGDIVGNPMLAHKAVHEAHVAAEVAAGQKSAFDALQIPSVAYTHPEIAWAGKTEEQLKAAGLAFEKAVFPWAASGRAIANGAEEGFTKLLFDTETHRLVGGAIVGMNAGDLIGEVCLAIEMGADALDIGKTIHPHPTLGESIGMAAEVAHGSCTDLPAARKH